MNTNLHWKPSVSTNYLVLGIVWLMIGVIQILTTLRWGSVMAFLAGILFFVNALWARSNAAAIIEGDVLLVQKDYLSKKRYEKGSLTDVTIEDEKYLVIQPVEGKARKISLKSVVEEEVAPFIEAARLFIKD